MKRGEKKPVRRKQDHEPGREESHLLHVPSIATQQPGLHRAPLTLPGAGLRGMGGDGQKLGLCSPGRIICHSKQDFGGGLLWTPLIWPYARPRSRPISWTWPWDFTEETICFKPECGYCQAASTQGKKGVPSPLTVCVGTGHHEAEKQTQLKPPLQWQRSEAFRVSGPSGTTRS